MGNIRIRKKGGNLFIDFKYKGIRCREQTLLNDLPENRKRLGVILEKIEAEITLGSFSYEKYFPNSKKVAKFEAISTRIFNSQEKLPMFKAFAHIWYDELKVTWRISYQESLLQILEARIMEYFGTKSVDSITKADLLQFRAQLGKVVRKNGKGLSADYINRHLKILRMILSEAADRYNFTTPFRKIKPLKIPKPDVEPFSLDEINKIISKVRADFKYFYIVRFFTGLRTGELHGLRWHYIDFIRRQILVRETIVKGRVEYTKNDGSQRAIEMSEAVYQALKSQYEITGKGNYVFATRVGTPLDNKNVTNRIWYPLLKELKFNKRVPYQSRHTTATLWLAAGENPEWIANQMGHENTKMLFETYSRYVPNLTRQDGSAFDQLLNTNIDLKRGDENV